jgi:hypothetical protein
LQHSIEHAGVAGRDCELLCRRTSRNALEPGFVLYFILFGSQGLQFFEFLDRLFIAAAQTRFMSVELGEWSAFGGQVL